MSEADSPYVVLSSPLLLESSQSDMVDVSVTVDVPETLQIERTMARIRMIGNWLSRSWPRNWIGKRGLHALTWLSTTARRWTLHKRGGIARDTAGTRGGTLTGE